MKAFPPGLVAYKRTPEFTEASVPAGLLNAHNTKEGVWGKLVVVHGSILYRILEPEIEEILLSEGQFGVIEPKVLHEVEPVQGVRFYVEFYRAAPAEPL
jgi:tellurite resistance-related uncharacterized protein